MGGYVVTAIIWARQAGLATGYQLERLGRSFVFVDGNRRVGDNWRQQSGLLPEAWQCSNEAMFGIAAGRVSPPLAGEIYCTMIDACQEVLGPGSSR